MLNLRIFSKSSHKYIGSGILKTFAQTISGLIVLRWLEPEAIGNWQSFTVFVGYIQILTLGVTSGLNRELPYWLGKGEEEVVMRKLKSAGSFITSLSLGLMLVIILIALILRILDWISLENTLMLIFAFSTGALTIQTNFLGATFRTSNSFDQLSKIQLFNTVLILALIPLVYIFNIWGYIAYQVLLAISLFLGYHYKRPYAVKYKFNLSELKELIKIGFPIYFWGYLISMSRTIPRLILVVFGTPIMLGFFAPSASINAAMLNLPNYTNRYLFPQMSYKYGKTNSVKAVYDYSVKAALRLFPIMLFGGICISITLPYVFPLLFPKYIEGLLAAQIVIFSGVFYSINALLSNSLNSLKLYSAFKAITFFRVLYISVFTFLAYLYFKNLLVAVAVGAVLAEFFNLINYIYFLKKAVKNDVG